MPRAAILSKSYLDIIKTTIDYDPTTGELTKDGKSVLRRYGDRYYSVVLLSKRGKQKQVRASRVAWFLYYGEWTTMEIHYRDHDPNNLRIENLSLMADMEMPRISRKVHENKLTSSYKGVFRNAYGNYFAKIGKGGELFHLGTFKTEEEAALAYNEKAVELYGDYAVLNELPRRSKRKAAS